MFVWSLALFLVVRDHFLKFRLARYDLGNMVQAVWSTAHGRPLEITNGATGEQMVRLGNHVDPILALLAPLWMVVPTPLTLVAIQIVAVSLGAIPVFWLARRHLESDSVAAMLAVAYLAYPWTAWTAVDAFHPVTLAVPLFLFCIWFLDTDRLVPFAVCAILAASTGELMALGIAGLGIWYALARGHRLAGVVTAAIAVAWTAVALYIVVPAFSGSESPFYGAYRDVGGSPFGILEKAVTDPAEIAAAIGGWGDLLYVFLLAAPLGGLFVLAPGLAAVALPQLAANLLAGFTATTDPHAHYIAAILPFLFAATVIGLARLSASGRVRGALLVLTLSAVSSVMAGPWPGALGGSPGWYHRNATERRLAALNAAVDLVPDGAAVSTTNRLGSDLSARRYVYSAPVVGRASWVVLDLTDSWIPKSVGGYPDPPALEAFHSRLAESAEWRRVFAQGPVVVYRRVRS